MNNDKPLHGRAKDMTGQRFGRLLVISHVGNGGQVSRGHRWLCQCDCGGSSTTQGSALRSGSARSCGCLQRDIARAAGDRTRTHGMTRTPTHIVWEGMIRRCYAKRAKDFSRYGARGIEVCASWHTFANFLADMGERPQGLSLDRIDNDKGYSPDNCRWATITEQARNTRASRILRLGSEAKTMAEWAEQLGINYATLGARLLRGWNEDLALSTPVNRRFSRA